MPDAGVRRQPGDMTGACAGVTGASHSKGGCAGSSTNEGAGAGGGRTKAPAPPALGDIAGVVGSVAEGGCWGGPLAGASALFGGMETAKPSAGPTIRGFDDGSGTIDDAGEVATSGEPGL
jgi:hypothetical protein